jgi:hypothetical protein
MIRAVGPSIGIPGTLQDPTLELHDPTGAVIASNDNWRSTQIGGLIASDQVIDLHASSIAPTNDAEAAMIVTLAPGIPFTAVVRGANNGTGIALIEVYDLDAGPTSTLANISTRGAIQTGDNVMIAGTYILGGTGITNVVVRGIGPSLKASNIPTALDDPTLELHDSNGRTVMTNDDWAQSPRAAELIAAGLQPSSSAESAMFLSGLALGPYTAILQGKGGGIGVGLVEVYVFQ